METTSPRFIFTGQLLREYLILPSDQVLLDVPGGNLLYAAVGLLVWEAEPPPGIVARVGEDYPRVWLAEFERRGMDVRGVNVLPQSVDVRSFKAFASLSNYSSEEPVVHFARLGVPFPKALLGYRNIPTNIDSRTRLLETSLRQSDIPPEYLDAHAAHLCPQDYLTHSLLPAVLRQAEFTTITLDPSPGYMNPTYWEDIPALLTGLTAFLPSEEELRTLFQGRSADLWQMLEALSSYGCEIVVVKRGEGGQWLYDASTRSRWEIPAYPSRLVDPSGVGDAFCGGFLAGYRKTYDPLEAVLYGNISASLVIEGVGPFYALDALPGLAEARLEALRQSVRRA
ncbi:MAG TPA: carbohydrate kinase family protein [Anaerolineales bacterium]|nr:carbohydrate kinase family protein [Anaerolineales bacterium]